MCRIGKKYGLKQSAPFSPEIFLDGLRGSSAGIILSINTVNTQRTAMKFMPLPYQCRSHGGGRERSRPFTKSPPLLFANKDSILYLYGDLM